MLFPLNFMLYSYPRVKLLRIPYNPDILGDKKNCFIPFSDTSDMAQWFFLYYLLVPQSNRDHNVGVSSCGPTSELMIFESQGKNLEDKIRWCFILNNAGFVYKQTPLGY